VHLWSLSKGGEESLGPSCGGAVPWGTPLIERREGRYAVREQADLERLFGHAYRGDLNPGRLMRGLRVVASALDGGGLWISMSLSRTFSKNLKLIMWACGRSHSSLVNISARDQRTKRGYWALEIVRRLYEKGLRPGNYWGGDFDYWLDEGCQAALDGIEREWIEVDADPNLAEPICWFALGPG
jgi:hypothetical protein